MRHFRNNWLVYAAAIWIAVYYGVMHSNAMAEKRKTRRMVAMTMEGLYAELSALTATISNNASGSLGGSVIYESLDEHWRWVVDHHEVEYNFPAANSDVSTAELRCRTKYGTLVIQDGSTPFWVDREIQQGAEGAGERSSAP